MSKIVLIKKGTNWEQILCTGSIFSLDKLKEIPPKCYDAVKELKITYFRLGGFPTKILKLKKLTQLNLAGNLITEIPREIGQLTNLKSIILWRNRIKVLPREIVKLKALKTLLLQKNYLVNIPEEIGAMDELKELRLSNNSLQQLPPKLCAKLIANNIEIDFNLDELCNK